MQNDNVKFKNKKPEVRFLDDMKKVLYDEKWAENASNIELYYMYRGIKRKNNLRYDITVIPPRMLGKEFVKTKGHEHPKGYQELIIVIEGKAIFLFQKTKRKIIKDVYAILAKKGETVIAPPEYSHITINPTKRKLKIANWIDEGCKGKYEFIEKMKGACYFYTKSGWIKNKNYGKVPKLRFEKPLNPVRKAKTLKALEILKFSNGVKRIPKNLEFLSYGNS